MRIHQGAFEVSPVAGAVVSAGACVVSGACVVAGATVVVCAIAANVWLAPIAVRKTVDSTRTAAIRFTRFLSGEFTRA